MDALPALLMNCILVARSERNIIPRLNMEWRAMPLETFRRRGLLHCDINKACKYTYTTVLSYILQTNCTF